MAKVKGDRDDRHGKGRPLTLAELKSALAQYGVTDLTVLQPNATVDPTWHVVFVPGYESKGLKFRVDFTLGTTPENVAFADTTIAQSKVRARERRLTLAEIVTSIRAMTPEQRAKLEDAMVAEWARSHEKELEHLGILLDVDAWEVL